MTTRKIEKSSYLQNKMTEVIGKTGFSIQELADKTGLSYGYMRRIVNGTVIPNRDALKRLCDGLGLDFATEWEATRVRSQDAAGKVIPHISAANALAGSTALSEPDDSMSARIAMSRRLSHIMDTLPIEGKLELLEAAWRVADKYRDKVKLL
jgi:transcriptional regulator with XRE-family HTH domain